MKLLKLPRFLVVAFTMILTSVVAVAQTLLGVQHTSGLNAQLIPTPNSTPSVSLNKMSAEFTEYWINSTASSNNPLIAQTDSDHNKNAFSACNCPECQGFKV